MKDLQLSPWLFIIWIVMLGILICAAVVGKNRLHKTCDATCQDNGFAECTDVNYVYGDITQVECDGSHIFDVSCVKKPTRVDKWGNPIISHTICDIR